MSKIRLLTLTKLEDKISDVYNVFEHTIKENSHITLAYSGGKDSTALAILLYHWLKTKTIKHLNLTLLYNDTLSEIDTMESWAIRFLKDYKLELEKLGYNVNIKLITPPIIDSFYWRVFIRGYPASTYNFRWCVNLLKTKPAKHSIPRGHLLVGLREDESNTRKTNMKRRYGVCSATASKCLAYYYSNVDSKIAPLRDWSTADIWELLRNVKEFNIDDLFFLYGCDEARYGCWHCTLVKIQWGLHAQNNNYLYLDALRVLYRKISDLKELRIRKKTGYSKLGAINAVGRSILFNALMVAENLANIRLYGLDVQKANIEGRSHSLRDILYYINEDKAMDIILNVDTKINKDRLVHIKYLRNLALFDKRELIHIIKKLDKLTMTHQSRKLAMKRGLDPFKEILLSIEQIVETGK